MTCIMDAKLLKRVATADKDLQKDSEGGAMLLQPLTHKKGHTSQSEVASTKSHVVMMG